MKAVYIATKNSYNISMKIFTKTPEETKKFAEELAKSLEIGDIVILDGELGTGKTTFTKGLAKGLGVKDEIISPTFMLCCIYDGERFPLYHFDLYRIKSEAELDELGFEEYFYGNGVCVIEWNKVPSFNTNVIKIKLSYAENGREIEVL